MAQPNSPLMAIDFFGLVQKNAATEKISIPTTSGRPTRTQNETGKHKDKAIKVASRIFGEGIRFRRFTENQAQTIATAISTQFRLLTAGALTPKSHIQGTSKKL